MYRLSGPMPEYVMPMSSVTFEIFSTDFTSTRIEGTFFSEAITTPFLAATWEGGTMLRVRWEATHAAASAYL